VSKIVSFLQDKNYRALPHAYPTKYAQERKESWVTSSIEKYPSGFGATDLEQCVKNTHGSISYVFPNF
jgi:hypothetical protein